jgi:hypothetical protein
MVLKNTSLMQLKASEVKEYREKFIKKQRNTCAVCKETLLPEHAALDHCHTTGFVRGALHKNCNWQEGRIFQSSRRGARGGDHIQFVENLLKYWKKDHSGNPIHPSHGKPKRKKKRVKRKSAKTHKRAPIQIK